jgi:hypothetical protein
MRWLLPYGIHKRNGIFSAGQSLAVKLFCYWTIVGEGQMHLFRVGLLVAVVACVACFTSAHGQPFNEKNPRVQLVSEFIRELEVLYRLQETANKEFAEDHSGEEKIMTSIRMGARTLLEMNESINRLDRIAVDGQWAESRNMLKTLDTDRIALVQELNQMSKAMMSGLGDAPKPGVDYGAMTAHVPELTAQIEQIDKNLFKISQLFFLTLVDEQRAAPDGKLYHLLLTKKERADMIQLIDRIWGQKLEDKNATYIVSAAWGIKYGLTRSNYKSADEP